MARRHAQRTAGCTHRLVASVLAVAMLAAPNGAMAAPKKGKSKGPPPHDPVTTLGKEIAPDKMEAKRARPRSSARADMKAYRYDRAAKKLREAGLHYGDPVLLIEASDAWLQEARRSGSISAAREVLTTSTIAMDMLFFLQDARNGFPGTKWQVIPFDQLGTLIDRADKQVEEAEALIERIRSDVSEHTDAEKAEQEAKVAEENKVEEPKPYKGMVASGATLVGVGVAGVGLLATGIGLGMVKQDEIDALTIPGEDDIAHELTQDGETANALAYVGLGLGLVGLLAGIPLLAIGQKRKKKAGGGDQAARLRVAPTFGGRDGASGFVLQGRF